MALISLIQIILKLFFKLIIFNKKVNSCFHLNRVTIQLVMNYVHANNYKKFRKCSGLLNNLKIIVFLQFIFYFFTFLVKH